MSQLYKIISHSRLNLVGFRLLSTFDNQPIMSKETNIMFTVFVKTFSRTPKSVELCLFLVSFSQNTRRNGVGIL